MDDGKSIRYKDLYALFEHILEKSMRLEQRDWSESPVKVWVNTFKVFLDEFMTEYKPMDGTISKVRFMMFLIFLKGFLSRYCLLFQLCDILFYRLLNQNVRKEGKRKQTL